MVRFALVSVAVAATGVLAPAASASELIGRNGSDVRLQVNATARRVDLVREGYDVALRAGADLEPGLIARTLATDRTIAAASPAYLADHGAPKTRKDLAKHRLLMGFDRGELPATHWPFGRANKVHVEGSFFSNDIGVLAEAALQGHGIAFLPLMMLRPAICSTQR